MGQQRKTVWAEKQPDSVEAENIITNSAKAGDGGNQTRPSIQGETRTNKLALWLNLEHNDKILLSLCNFRCSVFPICESLSLLDADCFIATELLVYQQWLQKRHVAVQKCPCHPDSWQWRVTNPALTHCLYCTLKYGLRTSSTYTNIDCWMQLHCLYTDGWTKVWVKKKQKKTKTFRYLLILTFDQQGKVASRNTKTFLAAQNH